MRTAKVNVKAIVQDAGLRMLQLLRNRLGFSNAYRTLGISNPSMRSYLKGLREISDNVVEAMLRVLSREEIESAPTAVDKLMGLVKEDGSIDYSLASQIIVQNSIKLQQHYPLTLLMQRTLAVDKLQGKECQLKLGLELSYMQMPTPNSPLSSLQLS